MIIESLISAMPLAAMIITAYFFIFRPQQKKAAEKLQLLENLKVGNRVVLSSGLQGDVYALQETTVSIAISYVMEQPVLITVDQSTITEIVKK